MQGGPHPTQVFYEGFSRCLLLGLVAAAEELMLQRHQAAEELLVGGLGGWQDDAGLQEVLNPPQQVLAAIGQVGIPAKDLRGGPGTGAQPPPLGAAWVPAWPLSVLLGMGHAGDMRTWGTKVRGSFGMVRLQEHGDMGPQVCGDMGIRKDVGG